MRILNIWEDIYNKFTKFRKESIDIIAAKISVSHVHPDYITFSSLIVSFFLSVSILLENPTFVYIEILLLIVIILDALDGASARIRNISHPEKDIAADRFSELIIAAALINKNFPGSLIIFLLVIINIFLPYRFIPILPLRIFLLIYFFILWKFSYIE